MKIIIAVPTHNESLVIEASLRELVAFCEKNLGGYNWQIVVADNGSKDDTIARVIRLGHPRLRWFHLDTPGKGAAIKKAWTDYEGDRYVFMDADLATDLEALPRLLQELESNDLVVGSRWTSGAQVSRSPLRRFVSWGYSLCTRALLTSIVHDTVCGFKGMTREAARLILSLVKDTGFFFDTELIAVAERSGLRIKEIPVNWREPRVRDRETKVPIMRTMWHDLRALAALRKRFRT